MRRVRHGDEIGHALRLLDDVGEDLKGGGHDGDESEGDLVAHRVREEEADVREVVGDRVQRVDEHLQRERGHHKGGADNGLLHARELLVLCEPRHEELPAKVAAVEAGCVECSDERINQWHDELAAQSTLPEEAAVVLALAARQV